jgi:hypothetical protein
MEAMNSTPAMTQREIRKALLHNGHLPIPVQGKRPLLPNWQNLSPNEEMIDGWGETGDGTGLLCKRTAALDIDVDDERAVQLLLELVRKVFKGLILERYGRAPKCAVPMYVPTPFKKIIRKLTAPDGKTHKIEFLCDGQQFVVSGTHPDTGSPYSWRDLSLTQVSLAELPVVTESAVGTFLDLCVEELRAKLGWLDISNVAPDADVPNGNVVEFRPHVTLDDRLRATEYKGELGINDLVLQLPIERLSAGIPVEDVIEELMAAVKTAWEKIPDEDPVKKSWDWNAQRNQIVDSCLGFIAKTYAESPRLIDTLPEALLKKWREIESRGSIGRASCRRHRSIVAGHIKSRCRRARVSRVGTWRYMSSAGTCPFARAVIRCFTKTSGSTSTVSPRQPTPRSSCSVSAARCSIPNNEGEVATGRVGINSPGSLYLCNVWSRSFVLRLFRNQNPAQVRPRCSGAELRARLEQAADRADARGDPFGGRQARAQDDEVGLIPHWAKDDKLQFSTFNARAENFATKPSFRDVWKWHHRCLVVTDGFYEWKKLDSKGKQKQPYAIAMADDGQMVMAGLWAKWKSPRGEEVLSCTVLTCEPNKLVGELHDRMPSMISIADRFLMGLCLATELPVGFPEIRETGTAQTTRSCQVLDQGHCPA